MKIAVAGKGGVGKTTFTAWLGDYLARQGEDVWLVDADTALSLGAAIGLPPELIPEPLIQDKELIRERVGTGGFISLNPDVVDLPERLSIKFHGMNLLVMGSVAGAGGGCACEANSLLKALLAHLVMQGNQWVLVDLEAGVEHLGRGTVEACDGLVVVSEASRRSLDTAAKVATMARELGLERQYLVLNRAPATIKPPKIKGLPELAATIPRLASLEERQLHKSTVLGLHEMAAIDQVCAHIVNVLQSGP